MNAVPAIFPLNSEVSERSRARFDAPNTSSTPDILGQYHTFFSHTRVEQALDAIAEPVLVLNNSLQVVFANTHALQFLGFDRRTDVLGLRFSESIQCDNAQGMSAECGTSAACAHCGLAQALVRCHQGEVSNGECRMSRGFDREPLDLRVQVIPLNVDGIEFLEVTIHDISDEKRRTALERVFFHDVLNTAGSLNGYAELLLENDGQAREDFIHAIYTLSSQLLDEIIAQQSLALAEHHELTPTIRPVKADSILDDVVRQYRRTAMGSGKVLEIEARAPGVFLETDPHLLRRTVGNMVKNALEATRPGGSVSLACVARDGVVTYSVRNPTAMPSNVQRQVFQRSFSTKGKGRGLGTYSMKLLTEQYLGGRVSFDSDPERGTQFRVEIPLHSPAAAS